MNKIVLVLIALVLTGCTGYVSEDKIRAAEELCTPNGGVEYLWVREYRVSVQCKNLARFDSKIVKERADAN